MRVIAGSAKGTRLGPVPPGVRPVSDRAREGLFSSLAMDIPDANVLDLFAGTGALGIEALSRGADRSVFVDRSYEASAAIYDNLARAHVSERGAVITKDVDAFLAGDSAGAPFDLVLLDPPYELEAPDLARTLQELGSGWLSDQGWTVVLTRGIKSSTLVIPIHWTVSRQLRYGDSLVILYREVSWA
jgi:16S rRNA (guanine966-N2)-methyltransferase